MGLATKATKYEVAHSHDGTQGIVRNISSSELGERATGAGALLG